MNLRKAIALLLLAALTLATPFQSASAKSGAPVKFIFDTDNGNDFEDILALMVSFRYVENGQADLLAICNNKLEDGAVQYIDLLETWMGHTDIPIGKITKGKDGSKDPNCTKPVVEMKKDDGSPKYPRSISDYDALPQAVDLYRKTLASSRDHSVCIVSTGFSTNLKRLMESGPDNYSNLGGMDLIRRKVKVLAMMAGDYEDKGHLEFNVYSDVEAARAVFTYWPTDIIDIPYRIGRQMWFDRNLLAFEWAPENPVKDAFYNYLPKRKASPLYDSPAVISVVEGTKWFTMSEPGIVTVEDDGKTVFIPYKKGRVRLAFLSEDQAKTLLAHIVAMVTAPRLP